VAEAALAERSGVAIAAGAAVMSNRGMPI
jgi:hypothetical protein